MTWPSGLKSVLTFSFQIHPGKTILVQTVSKNSSQGMPGHGWIQSTTHLVVVVVVVVVSVVVVAAVVDDVIII